MSQLDFVRVQGSISVEPDAQTGTHHLDTHHFDLAVRQTVGEANNIVEQAEGSFVEPPEVESLPSQEVLTARNRETANLGEERKAEKQKNENKNASAYTDVVLTKGAKAETIRTKANQQDAVLPNNEELQGVGADLKVLEDALIYDAFQTLTRPLSEGERTLSGINARIRQLQELKESLIAAGPDFIPARIEVENAVIALEREQCSVSQFMRLTEMLADTAGLSIEEQLKEYSGLWREVLCDLERQAQAVNSAESGEPFTQMAALDILKDEGLFLEREFRDFKKLVTKQMCPPLYETAQSMGLLNGLELQDFESVANICLNTDLEPGVVLQALDKGLAGTPEPMRGDMLRAAVEGMLHADTGAEKLQYVDMLFRSAYPEFESAALMLKLALMPAQVRHGVEAQHALMLSARALTDKILHPVSGGLRKHALARAVGAGTAPSLLLDQHTVRVLMGDVNIEDFNYHLANIALLQATATEFGLIDTEYAARGLMEQTASEINEGKDNIGTGSVKEAKAQVSANLQNMRRWCVTLGLDEQAVGYAEDVARGLQNAETGDETFNRLFEANLRFTKGLEGSVDAARSGGIVQNGSSMTTHLTSARHEAALYQSNPHYLAGYVLDRWIANLTGKIRTKDRLDNPDAGLAPNGAKLDEWMRESTQRLLGNQEAGRTLEQQALVGILPKEIWQAKQHRSKALSELLGERETFVTHLAAMKKLAEASEEVVALRGDLRTLKDTLKANRADRKLLTFSWPHQHGARLRNAEIVRLVGELTRRLAQGVDSTPPMPEKEVTRLTAQRDALLESLRGVDPGKLLPSRRVTDVVPSLDDVLAVMLPRANALHFFADNEHGCEAVLKRLAQAHLDLNDAEVRLGELHSTAQKIFGPETLERLRETVGAAVLKSFLESGLPASRFSLNEPACRERVMEQLRNWGLLVDRIEADRAALPGLIRHALAGMVAPDGTLDLPRLRKNADTLMLSAKEAFEQRRNEFRNNGVSFFSARMQARQETLEGLDAARRQEGVHRLMDRASLPGSGFVYDRTRGIVLDTGALFLPTGGRHFSRVSTASPLALHFELLHDDSLTVANTGKSFQVTLKGKDVGALSAAMTLKLPQSVKAKVGGGVSGERVEGLILDFKNREDCERFLNDFMNPESRIHHDNRARHSWMDAEQIRFVNSKGVSVNASTTFMYGLSAMIESFGAVTLSGTATIAGRTGITQQREQNALGETVTFQRGFTINVSMGESIGVSNTAHQSMTNINDLGRSKGTSFEMTQRFKVMTGPQGVMPGTCMQTECVKGFSRFAERLALLMPAELRQHIRAHPKLVDDLKRAWATTPAMAKIVLHWDLIPGRLEEARTLMIRARQSEGSEREEALSQINRLLASKDSYEPTRLMVVGALPEKISANRQPGLGMFRMARSTTFLNTNTITIPLPRMSGMNAVIA